MYTAQGSARTNVSNQFCPILFASRYLGRHWVVIAVRQCKQYEAYTMSDESDIDVLDRGEYCLLFCCWSVIAIRCLCVCVHD